MNRKTLPISADPEILSGEPVFAGTRVPLAASIDNLEAGFSLDEFLENFPAVTRDQAIRVLNYIKENLSDNKKAG